MIDLYSTHLAAHQSRLPISLWGESDSIHQIFIARRGQGRHRRGPQIHALCDGRLWMAHISQTKHSRGSLQALCEPTVSNLLL